MNGKSNKPSCRGCRGCRAYSGKKEGCEFIPNHRICPCIKCLVKPVCAHYCRDILYHISPKGKESTKKQIEFYWNGGPGK